MLFLQRLLVISMIVMAPALVAMKPALSACAQAKQAVGVKRQGESACAQVALAPERSAYVFSCHDLNVCSDQNKSIKKFFDESDVFRLKELRNLIFEYHGPEFADYKTAATLKNYLDSYMPIKGLSLSHDGSCLIAELVSVHGSKDPGKIVWDILRNTYRTQGDVETDSLSMVPADQVVNQGYYRMTTSQPVCIGGSKKFFINSIAVAIQVEKLGLLKAICNPKPVGQNFAPLTDDARKGSSCVIL